MRRLYRQCRFAPYRCGFSTGFHRGAKCPRTGCPAFCGLTDAAPQVGVAATFAPSPGLSIGFGEREALLEGISDSRSQSRTYGAQDPPGENPRGFGRILQRIENTGKPRFCADCDTPIHRALRRLSRKDHDLVFAKSAWVHILCFFAPARVDVSVARLVVSIGALGAQKRWMSARRHPRQFSSHPFELARSRAECGLLCSEGSFSRCCNQAG